jgi:Fe-Mn family superoxide dismutase
MKDKNLDKLVMSSIDEALKPTVLREAYVATPKKFNLKTEKLSEKSKKSRISLFEKTVENLNKVSAQLDGSDLESANNTVSSGFRNLKIAESYAINSSFLQAQFLENIDDLNSSISMDNLCYLRLARDFGDFDTWQKNFLACARSSRGGYAVTAYSIYLQRYINFVIDGAESGVPFSAIPVIVLDVNEGVYFKDYLNDVEAYAKNMMREFDWQVIEERFKKCEKVAKVFG